MPDTPSEELVARWLASDADLLSEAVRWAAGDDFTYGDEGLSAWVADLLYDPMYDRSTGNGLTGPYSDLHWVAVAGGDMDAARALRLSVPPDVLAGLHWGTVRGLLLRAAEEVR